MANTSKSHTHYVNVGYIVYNIIYAHAQVCAHTHASRAPKFTCNATHLLAHDPLSSSYLVIIYTHPIASNLPTKT